MSNTTAPTKAFWLSKTFWLNLLMILSMAFPAVRDWAGENPTAMPVIFAFVNLVLRTVTKQGLSVDGEERVGPSGGSGGILPLGLFLLIGVLFLPACSSEYPFTGTISYRDPETGAKGGLNFRPGEKPEGFVLVNVHDPETGEVVGKAELRGPLSREVEATK